MERKIKLKNKRMEIIRGFFNNFKTKEIVKIMNEEHTEVVDTVLNKFYTVNDSISVTQKELITFITFLKELNIDFLDEYIDNYNLNYDGWEMTLELIELQNILERQLAKFTTISLINDIHSTVTELIIEYKLNLWIDFKDILIEVRDRETCKPIKDCTVYLGDWNEDVNFELLKMFNKLQSMKGSR